MSLKIAIAGLVSTLAFGQFSGMHWHVDGDTMTVTFRPPDMQVSQVPDAPYSGEQVAEYVQTLADGTHIRQTIARERRWRDSHGRTRTEQELGAGRPGISNAVFVVAVILDPAAGFSYVLDDEHAIAHRFAISARPPRPTPMVAAVPPKSATAPSVEKLGSQNIEGVPADGMRLTRTIPIGEIGNDGPITTSTETWFSRDLRLLVLTKRIDQLGEHTTRLTQIDRSEPDPALFMPPATYTVAEEKESFTMTVKRQ
ncbi:MAG TPA: hypothetical protein VGL53_05855 [Bryobacteraceae bacterium]|jgi:hypothetical protein